MNSVAEVKLWGRTIGALSMMSGSDTAAFQYVPDFLNSNIHIAPLRMPLSDSIFEFPELANTPFKGLPGLFFDSLPAAQLQHKLRQLIAGKDNPGADVNIVDILSLNAGESGALEYVPAAKGKPTVSKNTNAVIKLAEFRRYLSDPKDHPNAPLFTLLSAVAKDNQRDIFAVAFNSESAEIRGGIDKSAQGFSECLLHLVDNQPEIGLMQIKAAQAAGIEVTPVCQVNENGVAALICDRIDRTSTGMKLHVQSLASLTHAAPDSAAQLDTVLEAFDALPMPPASREQHFRRVVFATMNGFAPATTADIYFCMDKRGKWTLAPMSALTYCVNRAESRFSEEEVRTQGRLMGLSRRRVNQVVDEVTKVFSENADTVGVTAPSQPEPPKIAVSAETARLQADRGRTAGDSRLNANRHVVPEPETQKNSDLSQSPKRESVESERTDQKKTRAHTAKKKSRNEAESESPDSDDSSAQYSLF